VTKPAEASPPSGLSRKCLPASSALESADVAPTSAQRQFVNDALKKLDVVKREWDHEKSGSLANLNAALAADGEAPIVIPAKERLTAQEPDEGEDLP
jgi:hypothetical protein